MVPYRIIQSQSPKQQAYRLMKKTTIQRLQRAYLPEITTKKDSEAKRCLTNQTDKKSVSLIKTRHILFHVHLNVCPICLIIHKKHTKHFLRHIPLYMFHKHYCFQWGERIDTFRASNYMRLKNIKVSGLKSLFV